MNEQNSFSVSNMKNTCRACLRISNNVCSMSSKEINMYESFVEKVTNIDWDMCICVYCSWTLRKCQIFIEQCRKANDILNQVMDVNSKSLLFLHHLTLSHDYIKTKTNVYNVAENIYYHDNDVFDDNYNNDYCDKDVFDDNYNDDYHDNDVPDNNDAITDDEIPLIMLSKNINGVKDIKNKKRKKKNYKPPKIEIEHNEIKIKEETELDIKETNTKKSKRKKNTVLREGFTSKMVQETNEYIVIKLSKEQVLQEMEERSKSETYLRSPYKCKKCVKGFNFEDVLCNHMEKHNMKNGYLQCDMCFQYCRSAVSLRGHIKSHTTRYKCKLCGHIRLSRQHLLEHHAISHTSGAPKYSCDHCTFTTDKRTVIQRHVKSHATTEDYACHKCGKLFKTINSLRVHAMRHDKSKRLQCNVCNKTFIYPSLLHKHVRCVHLTKDYYCVECDVRFKSPETMRLHFKKAKRHRDSSSYKHGCPSCSRRFISPATLSAHLHVAHGAAKSHTCSICRRVYASRDALRAHVWRTHTQRRVEALPCHVCGRTFTRKSVLKLHVRTHSGERPYSCECGAAFTQPATLRAHRANKHKKEDLSNAVDTQIPLEA